MKTSILGWTAALWGLGGFILLIVQALVRLTPMAVEAMVSPLSGLQWLVLVGWAIFMGISEGYRGFQKMFSPRFAARLQWLMQHPVPLGVWLAPMFGMGLIGATRKRTIVSWCLTSGIILLILGVRQLSQPWRGIVDAGVVFGLGWGLITVILFTVRALTQQKSSVDPEIALKWL